MSTIYNRKTKEVYEDVQYKQDALSKFLYNNPFGRIVLKMIILPGFSKKIGKLLDSPKSVCIIKKFIKDNDIDMNLYEKADYNSFNEFFTRKKIISDAVKNNFDIKNIFTSPADSKLLCYTFDDDLKVSIKGSEYDIEELVNKPKEELEEFKGGNVLIFRLAVDDYHRYCYIDDGKLLETYPINGKLHTVSSISKRYKIYKENSRVVSILDAENFGKMIVVEVGALLVGKIVNNDKQNFKKGEEKGYFKYGGSTIAVITKNNVKIDEDIINNSLKEIETKIEFGERIGELMNS